MRSMPSEAAPSFYRPSLSCQARRPAMLPPGLTCDAFDSLFSFIPRCEQTPASGKSVRLPPKRKQKSAAKASAKGPAKKRRKKIGSDEDEDADADVMTR